MQADRNVLEYQLQVAIRYGDTLRAESIKAKLAKLDQDLISKREDLADAQAEANKSLVGNSKYAIENRSKVRDLVSSYNEYLTSLAATGMSSEELTNKATELADEFLIQGESMGFAKSELLKYTDAFKKDFTTVINNLPKDINVSVVTDPALQAIIDFVRDANAELAKILSGNVSVNIPGVTTGLPKTNTGSGLSGGSGSGGSSSGSSSGGKTAAPAASATSTEATKQKALTLVTTRENQLETARAALAKQDAIIAETQALIKKLNQQRGATLPSQRAGIETKIDNLTKTLRTQQTNARPLQMTVSATLQALQAAKAAVPKSTINGLSPIMFKKNGGLVNGPGSGTSDSVSAMLSNGEYVLRANAVKYYGTDFMNSLNQMQVQSGASQGGSNVIYLSPDDRALLRSAIDRPISLYTENTKIAESANNGNIVLAQRGSR
jgi:hypothetical protein